MKNTSNNKNTLKSFSLKKSLTSSLFIGVLIPIIILKYEFSGMLNLNLVKTHLFVISVSISIIFTIVYLFFLKSHRCLKCNKNWVYNIFEDDIIGRNSQIIKINIVNISFEYGADIHLEDYRCACCGYEKIIKIKRRFIEVSE